MALSILIVIYGVKFISESSVVQYILTDSFTFQSFFLFLRHLELHQWTYKSKQILAELETLNHYSFESNNIQFWFLEF